MNSREVAIKEVLLAEAKPLYRAECDLRGDWSVWRRVSVAGWAVHERCENREEAIDLASRLNDGVVLAGDPG